MSYTATRMDCAKHIERTIISGTTESSDQSFISSIALPDGPAYVMRSSMTARSVPGVVMRSPPWYTTRSPTGETLRCSMTSTTLSHCAAAAMSVSIGEEQ